MLLLFDSNWTSAMHHLLFLFPSFSSSSPSRYTSFPKRPIAVPQLHLTGKQIKPDRPSEQNIDDLRRTLSSRSIFVYTNIAAIFISSPPLSHIFPINFDKKVKPPRTLTASRNLEATASAEFQALCCLVPQATAPCLHVWFGIMSFASGHSLEM